MNDGKNTEDGGGVDAPDFDLLVRDLRQKVTLGTGVVTDIRLSAANAIERLRAQLAEWQASQTYRYIGRDGKPVLARDLEDRADTAEAQLAAMTAERDAARDEVAMLRGLEQNTYDIWKKVASDLTAERDALVGAVSDVLDKAIREYQRKEKATTGKESRDWQTMRVAALDIADAIAPFIAAPTTALDHIRAQAKAEGMASLIEPITTLLFQDMDDWERVADKIKALILAAAEKEAGK